MKGRFAEGLLDALEFALKDFGHTGKDINIFDSHDGKPRSFSSYQPGTFGNIGHTQVAINQLIRIKMTQ